MFGWSRAATTLASARSRSDKHFGGTCDARANRFERHDAIEPFVPGLVDDAHSAASDFVEQLELAQPRVSEGSRSEPVVRGDVRQERPLAGTWAGRRNASVDLHPGRTNAARP